MRNECLRLVGSDIIKYEQGLQVVIYKKHKDYKIWVDINARKFLVQLNGREIDTITYDIAADAITAAELMIRS